ncbi:MULTISPECIES: TIGR02597 family protein [unclassified Lentimonas]|uniref:TIGR02597 family protein n=1 Tax=unclassified Lentimonas TaxID=2630993 RepID=UPI0013293E00|nr:MULTISPECIES: TIGR02597 family protein [unclassified Lentimonas]CAA6694087.1 Unannotated [Lentimonas sp. CC19]CAA6694410.1 Unannotated [Lentimonas sp. CC10]CAA7070324.1 Unannotated [Lentimonas sp. CC11]
MKTFPKTLALLSGVALLASSAIAQSVATDPVGYVTISVPAGSDVTAAFPMHPAPSYVGAVDSVSLVSGNQYSIALSGSPSLAVNDFADPAAPHFVRVDDGIDAGMSLTILSNSSDAIVVELEGGDSVAAIESGTTLSLIPYWTAKSLIGDAPNNFQMLLYGTDVAGTNLASSSILIFANGDWYDSVTGGLSNDLIIHPEESVVLRNSTTEGVDLIVSGSVPMVAHRVALSTLSANAPQDIRVAYNSPTETIISEAGFENMNNNDQLLVFDNSLVATNKAASQILIFANGAWYDSVTGSDVSLTFKLMPGHGYVFRKAATVEPETILWKDTQSYN